MKWVKAVALKLATRLVVANFIQNNIFSRFGIPKRILSDNWTPFINSYVLELCEEYEVDHISWPPLSLMEWSGWSQEQNLAKDHKWVVYKEPKQWVNFITLVFWAYRTAKRTSIQATPFSLVYGAEVMVPVEIMVPSARLALARKFIDPQDQIHDVETLKEKR